MPPLSAAALLVALLPSPALGHAGASMAGVDVQPGADGITAYEGNFGLLLQGHDPGAPERWDWICHEAITTADALITPRYTRGSDGVIWAVVPDPGQARDADTTLYRSEDGCDWAAVDALVGQPVVAVAIDPAAPDHIVAITGNPGQAWQTFDGGQDWTVLFGGRPDTRLSDVAIGADATVLLTGTQDDELLVAWADNPLTTHSTTHPAPPIGDGAGEVTLEIAVVDPDEPGVAWLVAGPVTGDRVWHTNDGGATVTEVLRVDHDVIDGAVTADGAVWLAEGSRALWRSEDGGPFEIVEGVPLGIGVAAESRGDGTGVRFTSFAEYTGILMSDVAADGSWVYSMRPPDVSGPLVCRDGTQQREICAPLWEEVQASIDLYEVADSGDSGDSGAGSDAGGGDGGDGGSDPDPGGEEGCCGGGSAAALLLFLPAMLRRRSG